MSRRLEFEPELYSRINRSRRRTRWGSFISRAFVALATGTAAVAAITTLSGFLFGERAAVDHMAAAFIDGLRHDNLESTLAVCAEDPAARAALEAETNRVSLGAAQGPDTQDAAEPAMSRDQRLAMLAAMREELAQLGVDWTDVEPIAFGGARAKVLGPAAMKDAATVIIGDVYFESNGGVFAVELSAWKCGRSYLVADIWQWEKLNVEPGAVRALSKASCASLERELAQADGPIDSLRPFFVRL